MLVTCPSTGAARFARQRFATGNPPVAVDPPSRAPCAQGYFDCCCFKAGCYGEKSCPAFCLCVEVRAVPRCFCFCCMFVLFVTSSAFTCMLAASKHTLNVQLGLQFYTTSAVYIGLQFVLPRWRVPFCLCGLHGILGGSVSVASVLLLPFSGHVLPQLGHQRHAHVRHGPLRAAL